MNQSCIRSLWRHKNKTKSRKAPVTVILGNKRTKTDAVYRQHCSKHKQLKFWNNGKERLKGWVFNQYVFLYSLLFANDQVVLANYEKDMEQMLRILILAYNKWGLEVNVGRTKCVCVGETQKNLYLERKKYSHVSNTNIQC